jgi:hypothetical protein
MFDWMTWSIEGIGVAILLIWIVLPIREFRAIFSGLRQKETGADDRS